MARRRGEHRGDLPEPVGTELRRPATAYADYLAWMRHFTALSWPERQDPLAAGQTIELATINGESIERHTFGSQTEQRGAG